MEPGGELERVLVTGANGHLGRRLIHRLRSGPAPLAQVRALVRSERAADTLRRSLPEPLHPEVVVAGYSDAEALQGAVSGCARVFHLVGILRETASTRYGVAHETTTTALSRAAARAGGVQRIVYLSILGADPDSRNPCLRSKGRAEDILMKGAVPSVVLRVPMVLGPGDPASRALARQARARIVPLVRGGRSLEQPIWAGDVVDAVLGASRGAEIDDARLDLAGPESLPRRELVLRCAALWGNTPRIVGVPFRVARAGARLASWVLANPPLTPAMLGVLEHDDAIDPRPAAVRLGVRLTPLDAVLRRCAGPGAQE